MLCRVYIADLHHNIERVQPNPMIPHARDGHKVNLKILVDQFHKPPPVHTASSLFETSNAKFSGITTYYVALQEPPLRQGEGAGGEFTDITKEMGYARVHVFSMSPLSDKERGLGERSMERNKERGSWERSNSNTKIKYLGWGRDQW